MIRPENLSAEAYSRLRSMQAKGRGRYVDDLATSELLSKKLAIFDASAGILVLTEEGKQVGRMLGKGP